MSEIGRVLTEAVRLLRESSRHFKSRQVAEARRLIERAIIQLGDSSHAQKTDHHTDHDAAPTSGAQKTDLHHD